MLRLVALHVMLISPLKYNMCLQDAWNTRDYKKVPLSYTPGESSPVPPFDACPFYVVQDTSCWCMLSILRMPLQIPAVCNCDKL